MSPSRRQSSENRSVGFVCSKCGQWHAGLPLDWAFNSPIYWDQIPEGERSQRGFLNSDFCTIDGRDFFVRGVIAIPVIDSKELFMWGVWATLSKPHFDRMIELWNDPKIVEEPPYFGWLSNNIPVYPNTLNLKVYVQSKNVKDRPFIGLEKSEHLLAVDQRMGITHKRVEEIAAQMTHVGTCPAKSDIDN
jgi:hypothetical protein